MKNSIRSRLSANIYKREQDDDERQQPKKVFFLSVEGNLTEKKYFENINKYSSQLGINAAVHIEVLRRKNNDTRSAPKDVIDLLEEYVELRSEGIIPNDFPKDLISEFGEAFIEMYVTDPKNLKLVDSQRYKLFENKLRSIGYDLNYKSYLNSYNNDLDQFCIIIDRDYLTHSKEDLLAQINYCAEKDYHFILSNPCFEFWLLLHISDIKNEYQDCLDEILKNRKISSHHTYISKIISDKTHAKKSIRNFEKLYLPNVDKAIERAKDFTTDPIEMLDQLGTNVGELILEMKEYH